MLETMSGRLFRTVLLTAHAFSSGCCGTSGTDISSVKISVYPLQKKSALPEKHGQWNLETEVLPSLCRQPHSGRFVSSYVLFESLFEWLFLPFFLIEPCRGRKTTGKKPHGGPISATFPYLFCFGRNNIIYPMKFAFLKPSVSRFSAGSALFKMYGRIPDPGQILADATHVKGERKQQKDAAAPGA